MSNQRNKYKKLSGIYTKLSLRIYISRRVFCNVKIDWNSAGQTLFSVCLTASLISESGC